uniref:Uncharacterized protein n=1 Tax=Oryza sativa subsp. japonica TaxID=39947 RepID=Q8LMZ2_ORYSJ|nr:hypothetical protein [Oryza sativa Japonica Group]
MQMALQYPPLLPTLDVLLDAETSPPGAIMAQVDSVDVHPFISELVITAHHLGLVLVEEVEHLNYRGPCNFRSHDTIFLVRFEAEAPGDTTEDQLKGITAQRGLGICIARSCQLTWGWDDTREALQEVVAGA